MNIQPRAETLNTYEVRLFFAWTTIFLVLAILAVAARLISRYLVGKRYGWDDALIVAALFSYLAQGVLSYCSAFLGGVGHPVKSLKDPSELITLSKLVTAVQYPYGVTMGLIRSSICALLLRIFGVVGKRFTYLAYGALFLTVGQALYVIFEASFLCRPFAANWNKEILQTDPKARCGDSTTSYVSIVAWGIACDVYIFLLPIPQVVKLKVATRNKLLLLGVFALGIIDIIVAVFRIVSVIDSNFNDPERVTITIAQGEIWGMAEPSIAIMVACGPLLRPIIEKFLLKNLKTWTRSTLSSGKSRSQTSRSAWGKESTGRMEDQLELVPAAYGGLNGGRQTPGGNDLELVSMAAASVSTQKSSSNQQGYGIRVDRTYNVSPG